MHTQLADAFTARYPDVTDIRRAFCPYRVCPIGAHSDHQHGFVTGFAIDHGIEIAYTPNPSGVVEITSMNFPGKAQFPVMAVPNMAGDWADYLRGATRSLARKHDLHTGILAIICGSLPVGGLSSSAAVIIAYLSALSVANDVKLSSRELIDTALWAENAYVGVSCGKLDQSCEVFSRRDHMLYLDTRDDSFELIPVSPSAPPHEFAIFFSGVQRTLVGTRFNMRVDELKAAAFAVKSYESEECGTFTDARLRDVPEEIFMKYAARMPAQWRLRAAHFYSEMHRVHRGAAAWKRGDLEEFGRCIFESGASSINNYQTGSDELIAIYEIMRRTKGIYGGRFSGAGFKGCCMALIDPLYKEEIARTVADEYLKSFPQYAETFNVHFCKSADGVG